MTVTVNEGIQDIATDAVTPILEGQTILLYGGTPPDDAKDTQANAAIASGTISSIAASNGDSGAAFASFTVTGLSEAGAGTDATHFRIEVTSGEIIQGTVTATGGGGDLTMSNVNIADAQEVTFSNVILRLFDGSA